jgi:hypothetical protein
MPKRSLGADDLLGKLLQGAVEYTGRCQETFEDEQGPMVELAREQTPQLQQLVETLKQNLDDLEGQLRKKDAERVRPRLGDLTDERSAFKGSLSVPERLANSAALRQGRIFPRRSLSKLVRGLAQG